MSDEENEIDILQDIKALEHALTQKSLLLQDEDSDNDNVEDDLSSSITLQNDEIYLPISKYETECEDVHDVVESALEANERLSEAYKLALEAVNNRLDECIKRQQEVLYQIQLIERGGKANWRIPYIKAGFPYFKDENLFRAPANEDELLKLKRDEFAIVYSRPPSKWSPKGRANLWKASYANASAKYFELMKSVNRNKDTALDKDSLIPSDFPHILTALGDTELDWMKISVKDMKNRYTWQACKAMWDLHMKPTNNRDKWQKDEDKRLTSLAKSLKYQNWDLIAEKLGTGRTCYQCFVRYNTISPPSPHTINVNGPPWTALENDLVIELIGKLRTGDLIPWTLVTFYLGTKTKNQIYSRWRYNMNPTIKKGRFTSKEDQTLLNAVDKYGKNFSRIAAEFFPHRSSVQLSNRFQLLILKTDEFYNSFTLTDDKRLLALYDEFGNNWSVIGNIMNRNRTYIRHRHNSLTNHLSKGIQLHNVPRKHSLAFVNCDDIIDDNEIDTRVKDNIDVQLLQYFHDINTFGVLNKGPGRKRKNHTAKQLEARTKRLHDVFTKLHVNFNIPDNLDDFEELTDLDKQLLVSYKQTYVHNVSKYTPDQIEEYRLKMFRTNKLDDDTEHFIPPAPFGLFQNIRKRGNSKRKNTRIDDNDCNLELVMEFHTPKNVTGMMNEDEVEIFDKFTSLVTQNCRISQYIGRFEEHYVNPLTLADNSIECSDSQPGPSFVIDEKPIARAHNTFLEPCYATLVGYQCLLNMQKMIHKNSMIDDTLIEKRFPHKDGKQAIRLLKDRLLTLFKYPIGMSRIPVDYQLPNNDEDVDDEDKVMDIDEEHVDDDELNASIATSENSIELPMSECETEIDGLISGHVEVSTPVRLNLNTIKTLRKKKKKLK